MEHAGGSSSAVSIAAAQVLASRMTQSGAAQEQAPLSSLLLVDVVAEVGRIEAISRG